MSVVGTRIDGRLVHGQVANLWTPKLQIDRIIVLDENAVNSDIEKAGLRMATPNTTRLSVIPIEKAVKQINDNRYGKQRILIVAKKPEILLEAIKLGLKLPTINVGTMSQTNTTISVTKQINVEKEDIDCFKELANKGVKLTAQLTPSDESHDFMKLLASKI